MNPGAIKGLADLVDKPPSPSGLKPGTTREAADAAGRKVNKSKEMKNKCKKMKGK
jgi:hypothetical protein